MRSADLQSAVSQNYILQALDNPKSAGVMRRAADCKSAIQQIANLRYQPSRTRSVAEALVPLLSWCAGATLLPHFLLFRRTGWDGPF
jgi:hypothetical protein